MAKGVRCSAMWGDDVFGRYPAFFVIARRLLATKQSQIYGNLRRGLAFRFKSSPIVSFRAKRGIFTTAVGFPLQSLTQCQAERSRSPCNTIGICTRTSTPLGLTLKKCKQSIYIFYYLYTSMKRFLLSLFLVFLLQSKAFSQAGFNPFKLDSIEYFETEARMNGASYNGSDFYCNFYKIYGDTVYGSYIYKKVYYGSKLYFLGSTGCPPFSCVKPSAPDSFSFYGFFRQDTLTKSNYFRWLTSSSDSLLVSYNLHVGDTIKRGHYARATYSAFPIVRKIDSILVEGRKVKTFHTDTTTIPAYISYCKQSYKGLFLVEGLGQVLVFYIPFTLHMSMHGTI